MTLQIVLEPGEEGGFTATVPSLPGCISEGHDCEDALKNIQEAIELYVEPVEDECTVLQASGGRRTLGMSKVPSLPHGPCDQRLLG